MIRQHIAATLESQGRYRPLGRVIDTLLIILILSNVVAIVLESERFMQNRYSDFFLQFEYISVAIFSVEYLVRVWTCVDLPRFENTNLAPWRRRLRYIFSPLALIDLLAILPSLLMHFTTLDLRFLRVLRLLRIFKLTRYSRAMQVLLEAFKEEADSLLAAFFIMTVILIISASGIYLLEHDIQPDKFGSIPDAMWWAIITLTTVGYGDVVPISAGGKLFGGVITILSMGMVAIPTGIIASSFSEQLRKRREEYGEQVHRLMNNGKLNQQAREELNDLRYELGLGQKECQRIERQQRSQKHHKHYCPHCGRHL